MLNVCKFGAGKKNFATNLLGFGNINQMVMTFKNITNKNNFKIGFKCMQFKFFVFLTIFIMGAIISLKIANYCGNNLLATLVICI